MATASATATPPGLPLTALRMFNTDIGWAFEALHWRVLRTSDAGRHWQDVTPPGANPNGNTTVFFLDEEDGWLIVPQSGPDNTTPIPASPWHTVDGGVTWTRGQSFSYVGENAGGNLTFIDARHGWYRANLGGQLGVFASAVFQTTDGGEQWDPVMLNSAAPTEPTTPGSFPTCSINGLAFLDATQGWAAGTCLGPDPAFSATQDGGRTWQPQKLSLPADESGPINCQGCAVFPPIFTSLRHGVALAMMISPKYGAVDYLTDDAGTTWRPYALGQLIVWAPDFVNVNVGWFLGRGYAGDTPQLYMTRDGGVSWTAVQSNTPPGQGIEFVTEQRGWSWSPDGLLLETEDGGATWSPIYAVLNSP